MGVVRLDLPAYRGWSPLTTLSPHSEDIPFPLRSSSTMKLLLVLFFITLSLGWEDKKMMKYWEKMKAYESCWGEETFKQYMVSFKKSVTKCHGEDAPELSLPPFRSTYRFVNTLMNSANDLEDNQSTLMMMMMMRMMMQNQNQDSYRNNNVFSSNSNPMSRFLEMFRNSRSKRQADNTNLDLGDRLVEKLEEKQYMMEEKIGNMTCIMKEMGCLNHNNELDPEGMKEKMKEYNYPSPWFAKKYEEMIDTCYEMCENLPDKIKENSVVTGENFGTVNVGMIKFFMKCCKAAEGKLCMANDMKNKIESNFGPLQEIPDKTKLTEYELFPLVMQLLHGDEMEYMFGDM